MKSSQGTWGRVFVLRLEDGDRVPDCIERFAAEHRIERAVCTLLASFGSGQVVSGPVDPEARPVTCHEEALAGVHEAAAVGTLFPAEDGSPRLHLHGALGRDARPRVGCLRLGVEVWQYGEVILMEITGVGFHRRRDPATGFEVLG